MNQFNTQTNNHIIKHIKLQRYMRAHTHIIYMYTHTIYMYMKKGLQVEEERLSYKYYFFSKSEMQALSDPIP